MSSDLPALRHSAAHVLAYAVQDLFPDAKPTIGPAIENGFYYDFDRSEPFTPDDLEKLDAYLLQLEEAQKRDHRKLGQELDLFSVQEEAGGGLIFWHPKGTVVRQIIEDFIREGLRARGYLPVVTPHVVSEKLYAISGHL